MKRFALITVALLLLLGGLAWFNQRAIGEFLFERAVDNRAGVDRTVRLPDGLHTFVCGSGSPMPDPERAGPCLAVLAGQRGFVFDAGSGSVRKLGSMGFPMDRLDAAFLTHLHSDHIDGLGELMLQAWMAGGRAAPLPIYGPPRTDAVVAGFVEAYTPDRGYRIAHHGPEVARPGGFGGEARVIALDGLSGRDGVVYRADGVTIRALPVDHAPVDHALAYRIDYGGRSVVISGDTTYSEDLANFARGVDLIFHEALNPAMIGTIGRRLEQRGNEDGARIMADIPDYHTAPDDAARLAQAAGAQALVLYHLVPAPPARLVEAAFLGKAHSLFDGQLELARDGMSISLPAGSEAIEFDDQF